MALVPFLLVATSAILSYAYRRAKTKHFSSHDRFRIIRAHAFAIEIIQIFTLIAGLYTAVYALHAGFNIRLLSIGLYVVAIFLIDLIDNYIQLGKWQHPYQNQTLLLTRNKLMPWTVRRSFWKHRDSLKLLRRRRQRQRSSSCPPRLFVSASSPGEAPPPESPAATRSASVANGSEGNIIGSRSLSTTFSTAPDTHGENVLEKVCTPRRASSPAFCPKEISVKNVEEKETKPENPDNGGRTSLDVVQIPSDTPIEGEMSPYQILTPPSDSSTTILDTPTHKPAKPHHLARSITPASIAPKHDKTYGKIFDFRQKFVQEYEDRRGSEPAWKIKKHMRHRPEQELIDEVDKSQTN